MPDTPDPAEAVVATVRQRAVPTTASGEECEVRVDAVVAGGDGLGRLADGTVVFIEGALPGETVRTAIVERKRDFARGSVMRVIVPSPARRQPPCPLAERCGGCQWQHVDLVAQGNLKRAIVVDALRRIAHIGDELLAPDVTTVAGDAYRTTVRLAVGVDGRPAYHRRHSPELVTPDACAILHPALEELVVASRFPGAEHVVLRVGAATGDRLAWATGPRAGSVTVPPGVRTGPRASVREDVGGRRWTISAGSFFQSGPAAAEALVDAVASAAERARPGATVVDAYAGVGVLGGVIATRLGSPLVAVESSAPAATDAARNLADLDATVIRAEVASTEWPAPAGAGVVIADPARPGLGRSAAARLAAIGAPLLVLVSCDPASFARDVVLLGASGYVLSGARVLDLFPWTHHGEVVSTFELAADRSA